MKVVLFCGGLGTRLKDHSGEMPKPMVKIGARPILWHIMKYYAHYGHKDFILCLGYKGETIKNFFLTYEQYLSSDFTLSNGSTHMHEKENDMGGWESFLASSTKKIKLQWLSGVNFAYGIFVGLPMISILLAVYWAGSRYARVPQVGGNIHQKVFATSVLDHADP